VHSLRTVVGSRVSGCCGRSRLSFALSVTACAISAHWPERIYDLPLFVPLWIEARSRRRHGLRKRCHRPRGRIVAGGAAMSWRLFVGAALVLTACAPPVAHNTGVYLLVDTRVRTTGR